MLIEFFTSETGRAGMKITTDELKGRELLRRKVKFSERKAFFDKLSQITKDVNAAQESGDEDTAIEKSMDLVIEMVEGLTREDLYEMDILDINELAEGTRALMSNGGKAGKKNE